MTKQDHSQKSGNNALPDLSALSDFQFGPAWARGGAFSAHSAPREAAARPAFRERRRDGDSAEGGDRRPERRPFNRDGRDGRERRDQRDNRDGRRNGDRRSFEPRPVRELPEPAAGLRVELRPVDNVLTVFSNEVHKQKRAVSLLEMAKVVMGAKERYDLVFMKQEGGPELVHSKKGDGACWISREEGIAYLWQAPWLGEFYEAVEEEVEAPKGAFTAIAKCGFSGQLIGPVNWHGYQAALLALHRSKFSNMPFEKYRNRIVIEKSDEIVAEWTAKASKRTVWKPKREGSEETVLADEKAVEKDFADNHFDDAYEVVDKVFVNGATARRLLAPGLGAHLSILSDKTRKFPQMLIPNLCHGMARHHMPIYKWRGGHYTGPSRPKSIPEGTVLADRMMAIANWVQENSGQTVDKLLLALTSVAVPTDDDAAAKELAVAAHDPYVADMIWLMEQGFILVMNDNTVWNPKNDAAKDQPQKEKSASPKKKKPGSKKPAAQPKEEKAAEPKAEQAVEEEVPVQAEAAADEQSVEVSAPDAAEESSSQEEVAPAVQEAPAEEAEVPSEAEAAKD